MNEVLNFDELLKLAEDKSFRKLRDILKDLNEADIALFFEELPTELIVKVFRTLPKDIAADVFSNLDGDIQKVIITTITDREIKDIIDDLFVDDAVDMLEELPANVVKKVLKSANSETRKLINQFLQYPENSTGSIMTAEFVDLKKNMTVKDAISHIRKTGEDSETIYTCYVTDKSRILEGIVTVKELLLAADDILIDDIMRCDVITASTTDDQELTAKNMMKYDFISMPVVDGENRLVGIVTVDDIMDVMEEETTEDIEKMAAILPTDKDYFHTGVFSTFKARIPWLMLLMISATFTGSIISSFEAKLTVLPALIAFIPMLMDTGGNSGSQASVTVIRAISLGDIEFKDIFKVIWKEVRVALCCAVSLAAVNAIKLWFVDYLIFKNFDAKMQLYEIAVVCLTLFFTVLVAKIVGCSLPILAKKIGFDPAVMASPLITTIVDALSLFIYFSIAVMLIPGI